MDLEIGSDVPTPRRRCRDFSIVGNGLEDDVWTGVVVLEVVDRLRSRWIKNLSTPGPDVVVLDLENACRGLEVQQCFGLF